MSKQHCTPDAITPVWPGASWEFSRQQPPLTRWRPIAERVEGGWTCSHVESTHTLQANQHAAHQTGQQHDIALHGARAAFADSVMWLANRQIWLPEADSLCVCCLCGALCVVRFPRRGVHSQEWCVCRDGQCSGTRRTLKEEQYQQVVGRCTVDGAMTQNSQSICQHHHDRWLQHFKPTQCAACPRLLSSSASRPCPEWMREQLAAQHGAAVHERPCYKAAVEAKKRQAADPQPTEVEPEDMFPSQSCPLMSVIHALTQIHSLIHGYAPMQPRSVQVLSPGPCRLPFPVRHSCPMDECFFCRFSAAAASLRCCILMPTLCFYACPLCRLVSPSVFPLSRRGSPGLSSFAVKLLLQISRCSSPHLRREHLTEIQSHSSEYIWRAP